MSSARSELVLPRPGSVSDSQLAPIAGPSEAAFTAAFGTLLPAAKFITTSDGKAAYYILHSSTSSSSNSTPSTPDPVLFIHGVQTPALGMLPLARALHAKFPGAELALIDLWGHGLSDTPILPHEPELFHRLVDTLLDHLQWNSVHLVGYSFGGALTAGYVASRSSRVNSFALVAPAGLIRADNFSAQERSYLRSDGDEVAARNWILRFLEGGDLVVPKDWKERTTRCEIVAPAIRKWQLDEHPGHMASIVAVFRDGGVMDNDAAFIGAVSTGIPAVVVLGELDDLCTKEELNELGFANVVVIPDIGHGVVREKAPEVADTIGSFWKTLK